MSRYLVHLTRPQLIEEGRSAITDYWEALRNDSPYLAAARLRRMIVESEAMKRGIVLPG